MANYGMVIDLTKCVGCRACMVACKIENGTPEGQFFMYVFRFEEGEFPDTNIRFLPRPCMHCYNPPCVQACPVDARIVWKDGTVQTDYDNCKGVRACELACPYGVNFFNIDEPKGKLYLNWDELKDEFAGMFGWWNPDTAKTSKWDEDPNKKERRVAGGGHVKNTVSKCTFCIHRLEKGIMKTACQQVCPVEAIYFGDLDDPNSTVSKLLEGKVRRKKVKAVGPGKTEKEIEVIEPIPGSGVFTLRPDINEDPQTATYPKVFYIGEPPADDARPIDIVPTGKDVQKKGNAKYGNLDIPFGLPLKEQKEKKELEKEIAFRLRKLIRERIKMKELARRRGYKA